MPDERPCSRQRHAAALTTFDALDTETGEALRGRLDATPAAVTRWVQRLEGEIDIAVEACTGWLFVCDALVAAGSASRRRSTTAASAAPRRSCVPVPGAGFLDEVPADARERIDVALAMVDAIDVQVAPLEQQLRQLARRQTGCRALMGLYGMGELTSLVRLCDFGDVVRLTAQTGKATRLRPSWSRRHPVTHADCAW